MHEQPTGEIPLPSMDQLGRDLLQTTPGQRRIALLRPLIGLVAYAALMWAHAWWLAPVAVFFVFVAIVTVTHDVVHGSLGLTRGQTGWALFFMGAFLLESGHAYRLTHHQHHRVFPGLDDPEGDPARMSFIQAILWGPVFLPRLWWWAIRRSKDRAERRWLIAEALVPMAAVLASIFFWNKTPAIAGYVMLVLIGSWVYPLLTVYLPHHDYGPTPLTQTSTLRGHVIPAIFLELTYHLEHHLYPQVPSHQLPELSRRLAAVFEKAGVQPRPVP